MSNNEPPKLPLQLLKWFCKPWYLENIEGDLLELYDRNKLDHPFRAKWNLFFNVFKFLRWRFIKNAEDFYPKSSIVMFKTYFKVSLRSMRKNKTQSIVNVLGLSIGIASCLLMIMHLSVQLRYDHHIPDLQNIYRVTLNGKGPYTPARLVSQFRQEFPEVVSGTRVAGPLDGIIEIDGNYLKQSGGIMADSTFFDVFPAQFISGDPISALNRPNTLVITENLATDLFPDEDPVGQTIKSSGEEYLITAVVKDPPMTTTIPYRFIMSIPREFWATTGWWTGNNFYSYLKLHHQADPAMLESKIPDFVERHIGPEILSFRTKYKTFNEFLADGNSHFFKLIPMADVHLHHPRLTLGLPGSYDNLLLFTIIAAFILIIASINYINMSTAKASLRAKEIGMRKVLGSFKGLIAQQFFIEALIVTLMATVIGFLIALICLPFFNQLSLGNYTYLHLIDLKIIGWLVFLILFTALLSGSYPALYLSSFKPIVALKGENIKGSNQGIRKGLVVFQFAISLFLMIATYIVFQQVSFMSNRNLGLDAKQVFIVSDGLKVSHNYAAFKNQLLSDSRIQDVGMASTYPSALLSDWNYQTIGENEIQVNPYNIFVSSEIANVWGLELVSGRFFEASRVSDTASIVVNEQLVKELGWKEPIGQILSRGGSENFRVIGVIKNFAIGSAKRKQWPVLLRYQQPEKIGIEFGGAYIATKIKGDYRESYMHIEKTWNSFVPGYPLDGIFMDDSFQRLYESEKRFGILFSTFSTVAIVIACIGMFALAAFTLERKRKEIALRKVMGAHVSHLYWLFCSQFARLMAIGAIIALPMVYYLANNWLKAYVERISIGPMVLILPLVLLIIIAIATISYQVYQSAIRNPVHALKDE